MADVDPFEPAVFAAAERLARTAFPDVVVAFRVVSRLFHTMQSSLQAMRAPLLQNARRSTLNKTRQGLLGKPCNVQHERTKLTPHKGACVKKGCSHTTATAATPPKGNAATTACAHANRQLHGHSPYRSRESHRNRHR